jgi:serine phosphatase RsbU (regulator of sigma subunit)
MGLQLHSILCVPFSFQGQVLGVVYLDQPQVDLFAGNGEVVELVGAFADLAGIALTNARMLEQVAARERIEEELRIAGRIQGKLLPSAGPRVQGLEVAGRTVAARHVGGDIYDFIPREKPEKEVLISIGDVSGKGIGAGLVMSTVRSLLRAFAAVHDRTDEVLIHVNQDLNRDLEPGLFVSLLLLRYHESTGRLCYTGAGHEHLVFYRPSTRQLEYLRAGGVVLGLVPDVRGRVQERQILLQPGDVVALYTDGATEARDAKGEELGLDRLGKALQSGPLDPPAVVDRLIAAAKDHTGAGRELDDDLTVVVLRKT